MPARRTARLPARQPAGSDYFASRATTASSRPDAGGTFTLQETNGQIETFNADGTLNYIQDTNGNRITAGYTGGPAHQPDR